MLSIYIILEDLKMMLYVLRLCFSIICHIHVCEIEVAYPGGYVYANLLPTFGPKRGIFYGFYPIKRAASPNVRIQRTSMSRRPKGFFLLSVFLYIPLIVAAYLILFYSPPQHPLYRTFS